MRRLHSPDRGDRSIVPRVFDRNELLSRFLLIVLRFDECKLWGRIDGKFDGSLTGKLTKVERLKESLAGKLGEYIEWIWSDGIYNWTENYLYATDFPIRETKHRDAIKHFKAPFNWVNYFRVSVLHKLFPFV